MYILTVANLRDGGRWNVHQCLALAGKTHLITVNVHLQIYPGFCSQRTAVVLHLVTVVAGENCNRHDETKCNCKKSFHNTTFICATFRRVEALPLRVRAKSKQSLRLANPSASIGSTFPAKRLTPVGQ